ncbi:nuclease-like protein [Natranaerovirga pectinivora]|uniref:Nuclease-like protein n=2 Tax=Natranaerovirga pectinivora TaxID=682400 RepID=A0A4V2UZQ5_9FIRM|nr:nuclease-like protein [Natranaerovirga pectinivora]
MYIRVLNDEFYIFLLFIFLVLAIKYVTRNKKYGDIGEKLTAKSIKRICKKKKCILLKNVRLPLYDTITEIDLIIICKGGVICVENKHLSGIINGQTNEKYWYQNKRGIVKKIYNPIYQNEGHIKCLTHHFNKKGLKDVKIYSYIVFSNKNVVLNIVDSRLVTIRDLKNIIKKKYNDKCKLTTKEIFNVINQIKT